MSIKSRNLDVYDAVVATSVIIWNSSVWGIWTIGNSVTKWVRHWKWRGQEITKTVFSPKRKKQGLCYDPIDFYEYGISTHIKEVDFDGFRVMICWVVVTELKC